MTKIKAILFDLDGTLRDSREVIWATVEHTLQAHDIKAERQEYKHAIHHLDAIHALYEDRATRESFHDVYREYITTREDDIVLYPGVEELLVSLKEGGFMLGVVSASSTAAASVEKFGLREYFDIVVGGRDVTRHKPHPEPVFTATQSLGIRADQAVMVGDLPADIQAGTAAGVAATVGLTHGFSVREDLEAAGADYIIDSLAELLSLIQELE